MILRSAVSHSSSQLPCRVDLSWSKDVLEDRILYLTSNQFCGEYDYILRSTASFIGLCLVNVISTISSRWAVSRFSLWRVRDPYPKLSRTGKVTYSRWVTDCSFICWLELACLSLHIGLSNSARGPQNSRYNLQLSQAILTFILDAGTRRPCLMCTGLWSWSVQIVLCVICCLF